MAEPLSTVAQLAGLADAAGGFLLTYLLHSTLLCGGALLVSHLLRQRALRLQEGLLRLALLGSMVTACLPLRLPAPPLSAELPSAQPLQRATVKPAHRAAPPRLTVAEPAPLPPTPVAAPAGLRLSGGVLLRALCALWLLGAALLLGRMALAYRRLRGFLAGRQPLASAVRARLVAAWPAMARFRLSTSEWAAVPLALGILRPEICLPRRALTELDGELLCGALLHEVGHLLRRDPAWRIGGRLLACLMWPQPLATLVLRRLSALAEYLCDDYSATRTGRPLVLARCLTEVAGWLTSDEEAAAVPGMLHAESELARRVGRLLSSEDRSDPMKTNAFLIPIGGALLLFVAAVAPRFVVSAAVAASAPAAPRPPAKVAAPVAPAAPTLATPPSPPSPPSPPLQPSAVPTPRPARPPLPPRPPRPATPPDRPEPPDFPALPASPSSLAPPSPPAHADKAAEHRLAQKTAALADAARRGDHEAMEALEAEVEALAEAQAEKALAAVESAPDLEDEDDEAPALPQPGRGAHVDRAAIRREIADAMRQAKEQIREARRHAAEQIQRAHEEARRVRHRGHPAQPVEDEPADEAAGGFAAERAQLDAERARLQAEREQLRAERAQLEAARRALRSPAAPVPPAAPPAR